MTMPPRTPSLPDRDLLTGLRGPDSALRRIAQWQAPGQAAAQAPDPGGSIHALLLRINRFASFNMAFGTAAGDHALVEVATRLSRLMASAPMRDRLVARVGGGTFLVAAQPCGREEWERLADELARQAGGPIADCNGGVLYLRPGIVLGRLEDGEPPVRLLGRLTDALEHADGRPGCPLLWADGALPAGGHSRRELEADLPGAIERGEIAVLFQPQFSAADGRLTGAEALARWRHPQLGLIGAETLFAVAGQSGYETALSRRIARLALEAAAGWPQPLGLSLNVTAADLAAADFLADLRAAIGGAGLAPERLTLEITEQSLVLDLDRSARQLGRLAELGVRLALDDFGAGFCNFRYLKVLPLHGLKLDRSMVEGIAEDPRDLAVLRGIVAMATALDLSVTAEGVETEAQRAAIAREGCATWQGFLGAPPLEGEAFARLAATLRVAQAS